MAESTYPFLFLNHGTISDPSLIEKSEEMYVWFQRPVTPEHRLEIEENCPLPIAGFFRWAEEFVHFGSVDDSFDWGVFYDYASEEEAQILEDFNNPDVEAQKNIQIKSIQLFLEDLENWARKVHQIVPIAFFVGSNQIEDSAWSKWSYEQITEKALPFIEKYLQKHPELASIIHEESVDMPIDEMNTIIILNEEDDDDDDNEEEENEDDEFDKYLESLDNEGYGYLDGNYGSREMSDREIAETLPFILGELLDACVHTYKPKKDSQRKRILKFVESLFDLDNIHDAVYSLSYERGLIESNASHIKAILSGLKEEKQMMLLETLKPYTQLAYYATYVASSRNKLHLLRYSSPLEKLKDLIEQIPRNRNGVIASLLINLAHNLVKLAPIYDENEQDMTHAQLAGEIMSLAFNFNKEMGHYLDEENYMNAATFYETALDYTHMLKVSLEGYQFYPYNPNIVANIIYAANQLGNKEVAKEYGRRSEDMVSSDEKLLLNQTYTLAGSGRYAKAIRFIEQFEQNGNTLTPLIYISLLHCLVFEREKASFYLNKLLQIYRQNTPDSFANNAELTNKFVFLLNEEKRYQEAWEVLDIFRNEQGFMNAHLYCAMLYTSLRLQEASFMEKALQEVIAIDEYSPSFFDIELTTFHNIASIYAFLGNTRSAIKYVRIAKKKGYKGFNDMYYDPALQTLKGKASFEKLFV